MSDQWIGSTSNPVGESGSGRRGLGPRNGAFFHTSHARKARAMCDAFEMSSTEV